MNTYGDEPEASFSNEDGPAIRTVGSSQPLFKRPSTAFSAAFEDPAQASDMSPAPATTLRTEFFELSPPR